MIFLVLIESAGFLRACHICCIVSIMGVFWGVVVMCVPLLQLIASSGPIGLNRYNVITSLSYVV